MDTYHLHLVFDIASFVGVSNTAALVCWRYCRVKIDEPDMKLQNKPNVRISWFNGRYRAVYIFVALYLALTILLGIRLNEWAPDQEPGRCYYSTLVTDPSDSHPAADKYYVGFTSAWLIVVVLASVFAGVKRRRTILVLSSLHFPLHLYMTIALRQANQGKFEGETSHENELNMECPLVQMTVQSKRMRRPMGAALSLPRVLETRIWPRKGVLQCRSTLQVEEPDALFCSVSVASGLYNDWVIFRACLVLLSKQKAAKGEY